MNSFIVHVVLLVLSSLLMICEVNSTRDTILALPVTENEYMKIQRQRNATIKHLKRKKFSPTAVLIKTDKIFDTVKQFRHIKSREFLKPKHILIKRCGLPFCYCEDSHGPSKKSCKPVKSVCKKFFIKKVTKNEFKNFYIKIKVDKKCVCEDFIDNENNKRYPGNKETDCLEINDLFSVTNYTVSISSKHPKIQAIRNNSMKTKPQKVISLAFYIITLIFSVIM